MQQCADSAGLPFQRSAILSARMRRAPARHRLLGDEPLTPARLEAFSDGVIAIILTIMVLELKVPATADRHALFHAWPIFISYVLSFFYVAVYWINHHHLFHRVRHVDLPILWANVALLFFLSVIPFFTEWMESTRLSPFPTAVYASSLFACGGVYFVLDIAVGRQRANDRDTRLLRLATHRKNLLALGIYAAAVAAAFYIPVLSLGLMFLVAMLYAVPTFWVERHADALEQCEADTSNVGSLGEPYPGTRTGHE